MVLKAYLGAVGVCGLFLITLGMISMQVCLFRFDFVLTLSPSS